MVAKGNLKVFYIGEGQPDSRLFKDKESTFYFSHQQSNDRIGRVHEEIMTMKIFIPNLKYLTGQPKKTLTKEQLQSNLHLLAQIPMDINEHLVKMMNTIVERQAKVVVELGVRGGVSSQAFIAGVAQTGGFVTSYDINPLKRANGPSNTTLPERLGSPNQVKEYWKFMVGSSLKVYKDWEERSIDVLFIDTDHTKEQIYEELNLWCKKVKENGLIMIHDVTLPNVTLRQGLIEFLEGNEDYIYDEDTHNNGMGFLKRKSAL